MSVKENKELVRRLIQEYNNQRNPEVVEEILAPDYVGHQAPGKTSCSVTIRPPSSDKGSPWIDWMRSTSISGSSGKRTRPEG